VEPVRSVVLFDDYIHVNW